MSRQTMKICRRLVLKKDNSGIMWDHTFWEKLLRVLFLSLR